MSSCGAAGKSFPKFRPDFVQPPERAKTESDLPPCGVSGKGNRRIRLALVRRSPPCGVGRRPDLDRPHMRRWGRRHPADSDRRAQELVPGPGEAATKCSGNGPAAEKRSGAPAPAGPPERRESARNQVGISRGTADRPARNQVGISEKASFPRARDQVGIPGVSARIHVGFPRGERRRMHEIKSESRGNI